jgi:hypothetical protein
MTVTAAWPALEPDLATILAREPNPIARLADGEISAIVLRGAFPAGECTSLVRLLIDEGLMFEGGDARIEQHAISVERANRWTKDGVNSAESQRRRIDIGTSLGNHGDDREDFFSRAAETHRLFARLFADRPDPVRVIYDSLRRLSPGKEVITAVEPDGRLYGPAIFRIHYGGYTYGPHFDSVRLREKRRGYAIFRFERQLAGVLCVQNSTLHGVSAQAIIHRQFWNPEIDPLMKAGGFHEYAAEHHVPNVRVELEPGDLYFFNTGLIHEVPGVPGDLPRIVLATFIGYSADDPTMMVWS